MTSSAKEKKLYQNDHATTSQMTAKLAPIVSHSDIAIGKGPSNSQEVDKLLNLAGNPGGALHLLTEENSNEVFCVWLMYKDLEAAYPVRKYEPLIQPEPLRELPYRISKISDERGLGMLATRTILPGETILWERPILLQPRAVSWNKGKLETMNRIMASKLGKNSKEQLFALMNCYSDKRGEPVYQLHCTNSFYARIPQSKYLYDYGGIFPIMSRCNHDCSPNANSSFDSTIFAMELRAMTKINAGEEIKITYISPLDTFSGRQETLKRIYKFTCKCNACSKDNAEQALSDERRMMIGIGLKPDFYEDIWKSRDPSFAKKAYMYILSNIEEEELHNFKYSNLRGLTQIYAALGDEKNTIKYAKEAKEACKVAIDGARSFRNYSLWDDCIRDAKNHPNWKNWVQ